MNTQEQYERYAPISQRLSLNSDVTDDPVAAERRSLWHSAVSRSAEQPSQCVLSRLTGNVSAGNDKSSLEVHLNDFDDVKEEEVHGYTKLHRLCILAQNGPSDPRWEDAYWIFRRFASAMGSSSIVTSLLHEPWRIFNLLQAFTLMSSSLYLRNNGVDLLYEEGVNGTWRNILILNSGLIWFNLLGIVCHVFKGFSVFVYATTQIFKQLINLFLVFIVIFFSFSTMLYMSSVGSPGYCTPEGDAPGEYCTLNDAMNKIGFIFFGALEAEDFDVPDPTLVLFIFYNVIVIILLLNIIIAVMSDSYTEVSQGAELIFWNHRFDLIHDVDAFVNCFTHFTYCHNRNEKQKAALEKNNEESPIKTDWFVKFVTFQRSKRLIPKPMADLFIGIVMLFWVLAGLCTVGLVWPRHIRRKMFAPTTTDHIAKTDDAEVDELVKMKEENSLLAKENAMLIVRLKQLQNAIDEGKKDRPHLSSNPG